MSLSIIAFVDGLQYLSLTVHPDHISFVVNKVCQCMHTPKNFHLSAIKHILQYLKATINFGLLFKSQSNFQLHTYFDADCGASLDDKRSTGGYCIYLGHHLVLWSSKKQSIVAHSSTEVEYKSLTFCSGNNLAINNSS